MSTPIAAPLTGPVTKGTWVTNQRINVAAMPHGFMQYNVLLPAQYSTAFLYPVLFYGPENDEGDSNGGYPADGGNLVNQTTIDGAFNTVAFRTDFPAIVVVVEYDQTIDESGENPNANGGGYNDAPNSGGNEQGVNVLAAHILATYSADPSRFYTSGDSLGSIACLADIVDNNAYNGIHKIWAAAMGFSDQLYRPTINNSAVFPNMVHVPYIAVSTPYDNSESSYDMPAWEYYTGNTNYPSEAAYASGGVAAIKAGSSSFYYIRMTSSQMPWEVYRQLNADGGKGTNLYKLLFSFVAGSVPPPPPPPPTGNMTVTVLTPTSGGSLTGADGNVWTMDAAGDVLENGTAVPGGAGTGALAIVVSTAWGVDSSTGIWYTWNGTQWNSQTTTPPVVPNPVTGLTVGTVTNTSVPLSWAASELATGYTIEMSTNGGTSFSTVGTSTTTSHAVTGLTAGTPYQFKVAGTDPTGTGTYSTAVSTTTTGSSLALPGIPTGLTGTVISATEIDLSWTAPASGGAVASYTLFDNGGSTIIATGITGTSFHVTGLTASTVYVFDVEAVNATGSGTPSATFSATTMSAVTIASVQAQISQGETLAAQLTTLLDSIYTNVGQL